MPVMETIAAVVSLLSETNVIRQISVMKAAGLGGLVPLFFKDNGNVLRIGSNKTLGII